MAGVAAAAGTRDLWTRRSPARGANPAPPRDGRSVSVTVDLSQATGNTLQPYLYGYASGALLDNGFQLAANGTVETSAETLAPPLLRFNTPVTTLIQSVFATGQPNWAPFDNWVQNRTDFLGNSGRLVFGIGPAAGDTTIHPATWAQYAKATAQHFQQIGQEVTHWEVGNECDPMGATHYSRYFNAIADALHSVNPGYLVGGPVGSWWDGIPLPAFFRNCGTRIGFIDFHSYPVGDGDSIQTAYEKAAGFSDVLDARQKLNMAGAPPSLPIGLLEYNMNGGQQPDGLFGLPAQGTIVGAVYVALLLSQAFTSDASFTMGAMWDLVADSNYGAIGNAQDGNHFRAIDEQGRYLAQAAQLMPGQQVTASTTAANLQVLATKTSQRYSIQLVNYDLQNAQSVTIAVNGGSPGSQIMRWELSSRYPNGHASTVASLTRVPLPPQSVVIIAGQLGASRNRRR